MRIFRFITVFLVFIATACQQPETYDLVISNGRVIDPETKLDAIRNIGIQDGMIVDISRSSLKGHKNVDASGLIVAPGFIDIHTHSPTPIGVKFALLDGVTTQLDLEAGAYPVLAYGYLLEGKSPIHFGNSVSHMAIRIKVIQGQDAPYLFSPEGGMVPGAAFSQPATPAQIQKMREMLEDGLASGGIGIGVLLDYMTHAVSDKELEMIFEVAGAHKAPIAIHVRRGMPGDPQGLLEVIALAEKTGAPVMICHITHSAMHAVGDWLAEIDAANQRGANITAETLTYAAGGTAISADVFGRDWRRIFNIDYSDVQWTATGEWLNEEKWNYYRKNEPAGMINHHYIKEEWLEQALKWPRMMASTDVTPAFSTDRLSNPNIAGTFSRLIGHYGRDQGLFDLSDALARVSLFQAQWLESSTPAFNKKGRIQLGMDADIVIFDANRIQERADYGKPYQASDGIEHVIVAGKLVMTSGKINASVLPGQRLKNGIDHKTLH